MLYDFPSLKRVITKGPLDCLECVLDGFCRGDCSLPSGVHYEKVEDYVKE